MAPLDHRSLRLPISLPLRVYRISCTIFEILDIDSPSEFNHDLKSQKSTDPGQSFRRFTGLMFIHFYTASSGKAMVRWCALRSFKVIEIVLPIESRM